MKKILALLFTAFFLQAVNANCAITQWKENDSKSSKTRMLASFYQDQNGNKKLVAAVHFKIEPGWKIYGQSSDGIGVAPSFDFKGSQNYQSHEIIWPQAQIEEEKIGTEVLKYSAYRDEVILPVQITPQEYNKSVDLTLRIDYGICKDICVPANETISLQILGDPDVLALEAIQKFYPEKITSDDKNLENSIELKKASHSTALVSAIILAVLGGAILNIMPCVLPVLSLKLLSIINHSSTRISRVRFAFFATICGIVLCFLFFALFAVIIKMLGNSFGWGLQFQNPYFLIFLVVILVLFIGSLLDVFDISFDQVLATILNKKINDSEAKKNIFIPNFLSGILAVLLATPCSAPLLGSAITFALAQKVSIIFLIFFAIGLGFALPYLILLILPKLVYLLPKPGNWMLKVKKVMAALLAITVAWLLQVLSSNIGITPAFIIAILSLLLLLCFEIKLKFLRVLTFVALLGALFSLPAHLEKKPQAQEKTNSLWIKFDEKRLYQLVAEGKTVVVDVTADWCITCKVNKLIVLNSDEIITKIRAGNIVAMRADITKPDEEIMIFLRKHNRFAIPFNAVYGPQAKVGILTSELLTKKELLELIDKAS